MNKIFRRPLPPEGTPRIFGGSRSKYEDCYRFSIQGPWIRKRNHLVKFFSNLIGNETGHMLVINHYLKMKQVLEDVVKVFGK